MSNVRKRFILFTLVVAVLPCCSSCGLFYYLNETDRHREVREGGYELCHLESCGPDALAAAFKDLGINKDYIQIGKEIQDLDRIHYREIASVVSHEFSRITCPPELLNYCRHEGLTVKKVSFSDLSSGDIAIILLRGSDSITDWHWIAWPNNSKETIKNYFGTDTKILSVYLLRK